MMLFLPSICLYPPGELATPSPSDGESAMGELENIEEIRVDLISVGLVGKSSITLRLVRSQWTHE